MLTFYRTEPFSIKARYNGNIPYPEHNIGLLFVKSVIFLVLFSFFLGSWVIKDIRPNAEGKSQKVKVKVRVNLHGVMTISSASMYEAKESLEPETPDEQQQKESQQNSTDIQQNDNGDSSMDTSNSGAPAPEVGSGSSWTKKISAWFSGVRILSRQRWPGNFVIRSTVFVFFLMVAITKHTSRKLCGVY